MEIILCYGNLEDQPDLSTIHADDLYLHHNNIRMLWSELFPIGLRYLDIANNHILSDGLPIVLPDTIERMNVEYNGIVELTDVEWWPRALQAINLSFNPLMAFPTNFPPGLQSINLAHTLIRHVDVLPASLRILNLSFTPVYKLPDELPASLEELYLVETGVRSLPNLGGTSLKSLDVSKNNLRSLPALPASLTHLNISQNCLSSLDLPANVKTLFASFNYFFEVEPPEGFILFDVRHNCLTVQRVEPNFLDGFNWNQSYHHGAAMSIQKGWRIYKMRRAFYKWSFTRRSKESIQSYVPKI